MQARGTSPTWLFAYGSLMWRPGFSFDERVRGYVCGWSRRFWQGSPDHRGVAEAPGRVVTLVPSELELCWGVAYRLSEGTREAILDSLDLREQGGYERHTVAFHSADGTGNGAISALVYLAGPQNPHYLGPAPLHSIAEQARRAKGPSGGNLDYVLQLSASLGELGVQDDHVEQLAALLRGERPGADGPQ